LVEELIQSVSALEVFDEDFEWNAGSTENWFASEDVGIFCD
jgi:hypothetical protein